MLDQNPQCGGESKERFLPLFKYISQWSSSPPSSSSSSSSLSNLSSHYTQTSSEKNRHVSFLLTFSCGARGRGKSIAHELLEHLISILQITHTTDHIQQNETASFTTPQAAHSLI
mmetsp:Transcript_11614/g.18609  ORF Transcript_11614/g.18609 Transcript_11614/m.18609 type:complete len:115 (+) Transcript_11614:160-504(+)